MSYLELLKKLGNTQNGNPQNHQNPFEAGSEGFEGTSYECFAKKTPIKTPSPAREKLDRFRAKGLSAEHAERVARMLAERGALDDRRSCAECAFYAAGFCVKRLRPIGQLDDPALCLHRCKGFSPDLMTQSSAVEPVATRDVSSTKAFEAKEP